MHWFLVFTLFNLNGGLKTVQLTPYDNLHYCTVAAANSTRAYESAGYKSGINFTYGCSSVNNRFQRNVDYNWD